MRAQRFLILIASSHLSKLRSKIQEDCSLMVEKAIYENFCSYQRRNRKVRGTKDLVKKFEFKQEASPSRVIHRYLFLQLDQQDFDRVHKHLLYCDEACNAENNLVNKLDEIRAK